jgi:phosphate transport system permease protein
MTGTALPGSALVTRQHATAGRRRLVNQVMLGVAGVMTALALVPLFWIIGYVIVRGGRAINWEFFVNLPTPMGVAGGGVWHAIQGTFLLTLLATIFATPPGVLAAIYVAYRPNTPLGIAVRFGTDVLAGVPSIVVGLVGYALIVKPQGHYSGLAGGIALAFLMLPTIIRTTEEMIKLVPGTLREGALALGTPEWRTALQVTLPAALSGIVTGFLLGMARASGETAPLLFTALGNDRFDMVRAVRNGVLTGQGPLAILNGIIEQPVDSLPLTLWKYAQQPFPERVEQAWAVALVLMSLVLVTNIVGRLWVTWRSARLKA